MVKSSLEEFLLKRFKRYTQIDTTSCEGVQNVPTTKEQFELSNLLYNELKELGYSDVVKYDNAIVKGTLLKNTKENFPTLVFAAHIDTVPGISGKTNMQLYSNYDGGDLILNKDLEVILSPKDFTELPNYKGDTLITTDGTSILGADNKSAIAEMIEGIELIKKEQIPHGDIHIVFLPDEEVGLLGAKALNVEELKADYAFTLDCCEVGEYVIENWNAALAHIKIKGVTAHPMSAKGKMKNSLMMATEIIGHLPEMERPEHTEKKEGYFWVKNIEGSTGETLMVVDIREFDAKKYEERKNFLKKVCETVAKKYEISIECKIEDVYPNVKDSLDKNSNFMQFVLDCMKNLNITPKPLNMRGGFDGTILSKKGLPCINIFCGAHNFHSIYEYLPLNSMVLAAKMVAEIIKDSYKLNK